MLEAMVATGAWVALAVVVVVRVAGAAIQGAR